MAEAIILARMQRPTFNKKGATEKVCKHCPERGLQPIANFQKVASMADGKSNVCRDCISKYSKARKAKRKDDGIIS